MPQGYVDLDPTLPHYAGKGLSVFLDLVPWRGLIFLQAPPGFLLWIAFVSRVPGLRREFASTGAWFSALPVRFGASGDRSVTIAYGDVVRRTPTDNASPFPLPLFADLPPFSHGMYQQPPAQPLDAMRHRSCRHTGLAMGELH
ncbi:uncharacterized protein B0T15DRAFT_511753 [Chaetomium strumarium]|uniref:Uncharacterized protein n=1 Tax=Chaetomium strumarium TaxID=1170767 RepID=A0AAJ0M1U0_9PEZI|nr:hypothetical protein B0T15DRAFT_511753 [Chaetomium strumarium]